MMRYLMVVVECDLVQIAQSTTLSSGMRLNSLMLWLTKMPFSRGSVAASK